MPKSLIDIETVQKLHRLGQLEEAKQGYLAILRVNPRQADMLHGLGILYTQQENFVEAISCLEKAISYQPNDPSMHLHLANVFKLQGAFRQAEKTLQHLIQSYPEYTPAYNNLGTVYYAEENFTAAIEYYRRCISKNPRYADAYYNLGLALVKQNHLAEAVEIYQALLRLVPEHFAARFQLANILMQQGNWGPSIQEFLTIIAAQPFHFETHTNLATCYLKKGALQEARNHYLQALELRPKDFQVLFNLGVICMQQGNLDQAIEYYQRAVLVDTSSFAAHNNLGVAFLAKQNPSQALRQFQQALQIQPNNQAIIYTVSMLGQNQRLLAAPVDYVQALFDSYADHYEPHLFNALAYQVPEILVQAVKPFLLCSTFIDVLDLGCGTGLCGEQFKPYAKTLVGVDVSQRMLDCAAAKRIYDQLVFAEIGTFLENKRNVYDLVMAGDVLVYQGELHSLFVRIHDALYPQGLFVFNTEILQTGDFSMNSSGRFGHNQSYLDRLSQAVGFIMLFYRIAVVRLQNDMPVNGHIYVLQKL